MVSESPPQQPRAVELDDSLPISSQLPARGVDLAAFALAEFDIHAGGFQDAAKIFDRILTWAWRTAVLRRGCTE